ncbi:hypothetical protein [Fulvivirga ligni]|uniref:hypothetical protein n=1 Tax=Fulvivirga ligni TaxID=2904246 RepID=UPI001F2D8045|nr:hypothetical protein [Fulvivirga ligni]UII24225.1 hypothetical protein LVD16_13470 [Fulvivirga ligni]
MSNTQLQKLELLEWIASLQDKSLIERLSQWKEQHQRVSIERYNEELLEADKQIEQGNFLSHEEAIKEVGSWREE